MLASRLLRLPEEEEGERARSLRDEPEKQGRTGKKRKRRNDSECGCHKKIFLVSQPLAIQGRKLLRVIFN